MSDSDWSEEEATLTVSLSGIINTRLVAFLNTCGSSRSTRRRCLSHCNDSEPQTTTSQEPNASSGQKPPVAAKRPRVSLKESLCSALCTSGENLDAAIVESVACGIIESLKGVSDKAEVAHGLHQALSDPLNVELRRAVISGEIAADDLVQMDEEALLNPRVREEQRQRRKQRLEQKTVAFVESLTSTVTHMFTCPYCGSKECYAQFRSTDFVKWQGDDQTPTLLTCINCSKAFRQ